MSYGGGVEEHLKGPTIAAKQQLVQLADVITADADSELVTDRYAATVDAFLTYVDSFSRHVDDLDYRTMDEFHQYHRDVLRQGHQVEQQLAALDDYSLADAVNGYLAEADVSDACDHMVDGLRDGDFPDMVAWSSPTGVDPAYGEWMTVSELNDL